MQLKSVACYNDVIQTFGRQLQQCCIQNFKSQCFEYNFAADCKQVVGKRCDQMAPVQTHCRNIQGCPTYKAKNLNQSFFTSNVFIGCMIAFIIFSVGLFFICRRASQPDTTFEIASERDLKKKKNKLKSPASSKGEKKRQLKA